MAESSPSGLDTSEIRNWRSIITLIVFVLASTFTTVRSNLVFHLTVA